MKNSIRLLGEDFHLVRWIDARERLSMLASGQAERVYSDSQGNLSIDLKSGTDHGTVKLRTYAPEYSANTIPGSEQESPTSLNSADAFNLAAGSIDTAKRREVYRLREEGKIVPAAIRCYGHDKANKPKNDLVGNAVDRSMSRSEHWSQASETNKSVTVVPGRIIGVIERELD